MSSFKPGALKSVEGDISRMKVRSDRPLSNQEVKNLARLTRALRRIDGTQIAVSDTGHVTVMYEFRHGTICFGGTSDHPEGDRLTIKDADLPECLALLLEEAVMAELRDVLVPALLSA